MNWRSPVFRLGWCVVCVLMAVFLYAPSFSGGFVFDDRYQFYSQPQPPDRWLDYLLGPRPLVQLSYLVNHAVAGNSAEPFRVVNAVAHGVTSACVSVVVADFAALAAMAPPALMPLALSAGLLFLAHPLQSEPVAYVAARTDVFCALFFLMALSLFLAARRQQQMTWARALSIAVLFVAAMASKEHAVVLPVLFVFLEWLYRRQWGGWRSGQALRLYGVLGTGALLGGTFIALYLSSARTIGAGSGTPPLAYFFTQWRSVARYLQLAVAPAGLNLDYDWPLSQTPLDYGAAWMLLVVAAAAGVLMWHRDRQGLVLAGLAIAALTLAPTSTIVPLADRIAERRMYLPLAGLILTLAGLAIRFAWPAPAVRWGGLAVAAAFALLTYQRASVWGDPVRLWRDTVEKSPQKFRPHYWLARAYFESGQCGPAATAFQAAYARMGRGDDPFDLEMALAMDCAGDTREAARVLNRLLEANPADAQALALRGRLYLRQGETVKGMADLDRAIQIDPAQPTALATRGEARLAMDQLEGGVADLERALTLIGPDPRLVLMTDRARVRLAIAREKQAAAAASARP